MCSFIAKPKLTAMTAGGFTYHLRARRYADRQWRPFRTHVAGWLRDWQPPTEHLIIFGSSAGYTLPQDFLLRFDKISIIEPDAMARFLFKQRFPRIGAHVITAAHLLRNLELKEWQDFIRQNPGATFLFSNVIGQMIFINAKKSEPVDHRVGRLFTLLTHDLKIPWASYHDILSTTALPQTLIPLVLHKGQDTIESLAANKLRGERIDVVDHGTLEATFALETDIECAWWEIEPRRYHLVGWLKRK